MMIHQDLLDEGNLEKLVGALHSIKSSNAELTKTKQQFMGSLPLYSREGAAA